MQEQYNTQLQTLDRMIQFVYFKKEKRPELWIGSGADAGLTEADFNRYFKETSAHETILFWIQSPTF